MGRRLRLFDGQQLLVRSLWLPLLMAGLVQGFGPEFSPSPTTTCYTWLPLLIWLPAILLYSLLRDLPPQHIAQRTDRALALHNRLATAIELETKQDITTHFEPDLVIQQALDAQQLAATLKPKQAFPLRWQRNPLLVAAFALFATLLLIYLPNRMDAVLAERAAITATAEEEAQELDELAEEIAADRVARCSRTVLNCCVNYAKRPNGCVPTRVIREEGDGRTC